MNDFKLDVVSVRLVRNSSIPSDRKVDSPEAAMELIRDIFRDFDREILFVINLKADGTPINFHVVSIGSLDASIAAPREMLKASILSNASSMIIGHVHPSGNLLPSQQDILVTDRMIKLCKLVGIPLMDHVIFGGDGSSYFSFKEKSLVDFNSMPSLNYDLESISFDKVAEKNLSR